MADYDTHAQCDYHRKRFDELKTLRTRYEALWGDIADFVDPNVFRKELDQGQGQKRRSKIKDATASEAMRTFASGFHSGVTSPARPWYRIEPSNGDMAEVAAVKEHIRERQDRHFEVLAGSNFYNVMHTAYGHLGKLGQFCALMIEDDRDVIRLLLLQHGSFWIARNAQGVCDTVYRRFSWSVERVVDRFGLENCSDAVKSDWNQQRYDQLVAICHAIEPRKVRQGGKIDKRNKPFLSNYWEESGTSNPKKLLEESGFDENPILCPPWELQADDVYASNFPCEIALPDIKQLQAETIVKLRAIEEQSDPALQGPAAARNNHRSLLPGSVTYVDDPNGKGLRPIKEVNLNLMHLREDIADLRARIQRICYADLFLMLENMKGVQPRNQFEIAERKEEKLLALGPVLESLFGCLSQAVSRLDAIMGRRGMLPELPPEMEGQPLKLKFISTLAQAQRAVGTLAIERYAGFIGNHVGIKPDTLDKYDADEAADLYADALGVPPNIVVPDDKVKAIREERAQAAAQQQQAEQAAVVMPAVKQGAEAARLLSEIDTNGPFATLMRP